MILTSTYSEYKVIYVVGTNWVCALVSRKYTLLLGCETVLVVTGRNMDGGGAYGGGKAGAPFDPIQFVQRPQVILRAACLVSNISSTDFIFVNIFP
jgi:hypothetical protein